MIDKPANPSGRLLVSLLFFFSLFGCSSGPARPVCHPVHGRITLDKQPIDEAQLVFHPLQGSMAPLPLAISRSDGQFDVTTWGNNDGAPAGDYVVTVVWKQLIQQGEEKTRNGRNMLPTLYADHKRSPLRCTIKEGDNSLPAVELKRQ